MVEPERRSSYVLRTPGKLNVRMITLPFNTGSSREKILVKELLIKYLVLYLYKNICS